MTDRERAVFPVNLIVDGKDCLVVGDGDIAARKAEALEACGARVTMMAPDDFEHGRLRRPLVRGRRRRRRGQRGGRGRRRAQHGVWVNAADDPKNCTAILPAVLRRGTVTVTVGTAGRSPAMATFLRNRIDEALGPDVAALVEVVAARPRRDCAPKACRPSNCPGRRRSTRNFWSWSRLARSTKQVRGFASVCCRRRRSEPRVSAVRPARTGARRRTSCSDKLLAELPSSHAIDEAVVLATCQRTEIYIAAEWYHPAVDEVQADARRDRRRHGRRHHRARLRVPRRSGADGTCSASPPASTRPSSARPKCSASCAPRPRVAKRRGRHGFRTRRGVPQGHLGGRAAAARRPGSGSTEPRPSLASAAVAMLGDRFDDPATLRIGVLGRGDVATSVLDALIERRPVARDACSSTASATGASTRAGPRHGHDLVDLPEHLVAARRGVLLHRGGAGGRHRADAARRARRARRPPLLLVDLAVPRDVAAQRRATSHDVAPARRARRQPLRRRTLRAARRRDRGRRRRR